MMSFWKIAWNKRSSVKYGWEPEWFGAAAFNKDLIKKIKSFQRKMKVKVDGLCGSSTHRRKLTEQIAEETEPTGNTLLCAGKKIPIEWEMVRQKWLPSSCYKKPRKVRNPHMLVVHWDATLSANSAFNILKKRNLSTHFVIDNDGTIVQMADINNIAWHAGKVNKFAIGIDFSNAYYTRYQSWYRKKGFGPRPILESTLHGRKLGKHLGYYPVQIDAFKALLRALKKHYGDDLKFECPLKDGKLLTTVDKSAAKGKFKGVVNHYHLTRRKIDCAGLELDKILKELNDE